jgi:signal transduction histidine kinase
MESDHRSRRWILSSQEGMLFNTLVPILEGRAGSVLVGLTDRRIRSEITSLTHSLFWSLMLCASVGWGLALVLTEIVTRPVRDLVQAASRIREGDFHVRSEVGSADEIGHLASAFNDMAESLEIHRKDVQEKERVRESLLERIVQVQEEERKRVARELHDEVGQSLSALLLAIQSSRGNGKPTEELKTDLEHQTTQLIGEVHRLAWGMRPSILDDFGLDSALSRLVQEIAKHSSTAIDYQYSAPPGAERPPSRVEVTLYRLAQEALSNVDRHSEAKRASVILLQLPHEVSLLVEDDGQGFELKSLDGGADDCLGIAGMKERVALVGGNLDLASEPGKGTTLRATIPLQEDKE